MFDGMYEFCQLSAGGSIGKSQYVLHIDYCMLFPCSWSCQVEQAGDRHCCELGWWTSSCQEE